MSKRTSDESKNNNKDEGSDSDLRQEDNAKRAKLTLSGDKSFHDLPVEVLERILVKAVVMEVKDMKLVKSVWKEKADLAIDRFRAVCSQWDNILQNDLCISEIHNILDRTAQETYRVDILQLSPTQAEVIRATTLRDEIFMLLKQPDQTSIVVYDRHNTIDVKDVIALPGMSPTDIAGCSVSNCVYVLNSEANCYSVSRITKIAEHQFKISPWICDLRRPFSLFSVSPSGSLVILSRDIITNDMISREVKINPSLVKIYDPSGSLLHEITLIQNIVSTRYTLKAIQKSNGNILLASVYASKLLFTEIDVTGIIVRQYQSTLSEFGSCMVDIQGHILICDRYCRMEFLDSELNPVEFKGQNQHEGLFDNSFWLYYNCERNEIVRVCDLLINKIKLLTIFRITEIWNTLNDLRTA